MPPRYKRDYLMKSQSNQVLRVLKDAGFSRDDFEWDTAASRAMYETLVDKLAFKNDPSAYFIFDRGSDRYDGSYRVARYAPGTEHPSVAIRTSDWADLIIEFRTWLRNLRRELDEPDLWSAEEQEEFQEKWLESNKKFSDDELAEIHKGLERVEKFLIEKSSKDDEVLKDIQQNIKYLKDAAKRSGRRDWMMMFIGTLVSKLSDWAIGTIAWQHFVRLLLKGANKLLLGN